MTIRRDRLSPARPRASAASNHKRPRDLAPSMVGQLMSDRRTPTLNLRDRASTAGAAGELHTLLEGAALHTFGVPGGGEDPQRARLEWSGVRWFLMYENTTWPLAVLEGSRVRVATMTGALATLESMEVDDSSTAQSV